MESSHFSNGSTVNYAYSHSNCWQFRYLRSSGNTLCLDDGGGPLGDELVRLLAQGGLLGADDLARLGLHQPGLLQATGGLGQLALPHGLSVAKKFVK